MSLFPTSQWLDAYQREINESAALDDVGVGWGVGSNGDVLIVVEDLPLSETRIGDLPELVFEGVPEKVKDDLDDVTLDEAPELIDDGVREHFPPVSQGLLDQLGTCVVDGDIFCYIGLESGKCPEVEILESRDEREVNAVLEAEWNVWQAIIDGRPATSAVLGGDLAVETDGPLGPQTLTMLQLLGDVAADVETTFLFEQSRRSMPDLVLDEAVRQPAAFQKLAYRQAALTSRLFNVF
ncbi:sterol carrier protein [Halorientalis pallida]|uniref:Sterol carrier protein n=1 Tax=Halorientalis pallida TaxID=2479928 RepID=A0A498L2A8_9EURY|nr:sterol carrier protein [Halorientalis pallida]RXK50276.1 sterol carrier protein [Halorientalis pallida]